jgi:hypothetical protein
VRVRSRVRMRVRVESGMINKSNLVEMCWDRDRVVRSAGGFRLGLGLG